MMSIVRFLLGFTVAVATLALETGAHAYCRTTTCAAPGNFLPTPTACEPASLLSCSIGGATVKNVPLWWRSACAGYDLQQNASRRVSLADATSAAARAFAAWSGASCTGGSPTIMAKDLGPVACAEAVFDQNYANQNVIVFHDSVWPHKPPGAFGPSPTIALTTVSFNRDTGEILDADIEINSADHVIIPTETPGSGVYDLESVLTHEAGHFFGIAHSPDRSSVMFYEDEGGSARHRELTGDDAAAICAVYPPSGLRPVDAKVAASGTQAASACDPTPRGGLGNTCSDPSDTTTSRTGCTAAPTQCGAAPAATGDGWLLALLVITGSAYRRGSRDRLGRGPEPRSRGPSS
jgi:hypothetical protein